MIHGTACCSCVLTCLRIQEITDVLQLRDVVWCVTAVLLHQRHNLVVLTHPILGRTLFELVENSFPSSDLISVVLHVWQAVAVAVGAGVLDD